MDQARIREDIVEVGRRLYARGLIAANEGNVSVRDGDVLFITPAGVCKGFLRPEMIVRTDLSGKALDPGQRASTETQMHVSVYRKRPDVTGVVHAHPPTATGFAVAGVALDQPLIAEAVVTLGRVPVIPYGQPSTQDLARNVETAVCESHALLMANHGAIAVGEDIWRAWERMETLEQLARVTLVTKTLGVHQLLPGADVTRLLDMRTAAGYPPPTCGVSPPTPAPAPAPKPMAAPMSLPPAAADGTITLTKDQLVDLLTDAIRRFGR